MLIRFKKKKKTKNIIIFTFSALIKLLILPSIIIITIIVKKQNSKKNKKRFAKDKFSHNTKFLKSYSWKNSTRFNRRRGKNIFYHHKIFIESHRGANTEIFENTMEAFKKAIEYGVDSIETDVWLTKDNVLVLLHASSRQGNLSFYYDHPVNVINSTWKELSTYRTLKDNLTMPRLRDLMILAKKNKIYIDLEIKDKRFDIVFPHIVKLIEEFDFFDQISITSLFFEYYNKTLEYNRYHNKNLIFGFVYGKRNKTSDFDYTKRGSILVIYWADATKEVCKKAHENGMAIIGWIDILDNENFTMYKQLIENGADVICCNIPSMARDYVNYYYKNKLK